MRPVAHLQSTTVIFENPPDTVLNTRQFQPGQNLRIGGHVTGLLGLGEPFQQITLDIPELSISGQTNTDILGDYWFDITLPNVTKKATITITATFSVSGQDVVTVPISLGNLSPDPLPSPPDQGLFGNYTWLVVIGLLALYIISRR